MRRVVGEGGDRAGAGRDTGSDGGHNAGRPLSGRAFRSDGGPGWARDNSVGCVDEVIAEPAGGSQTEPELAFAAVADRLRANLAELRALPIDRLLEERYRKFRNIAQFYSADAALPVAAPGA